MATPDKEVSPRQYLTSAGVIGRDLFEKHLSDPCFSSPTKDGESPPSVFQFPPTPISDTESPRNSNHYLPLLDSEDSIFRLSDEWVDLDAEMQLYMSSLIHPPIPTNFSDGNAMYEQPISSDQYKTERPGIDSIAAESCGKRKGEDHCSRNEVLVKQNKEKPSKKRRITPPTISQADLEVHFGKTRKEAAACLGVSIATLKRNARRLGIPRWPLKKRSKGRLNASSNLVMDLVSSQPERAIEKLSVSARNAPVYPKQVAAAASIEDEMPITVKVKYKVDLIKFELSTTSKMAYLEEEISKRLQLNVGSFKIKYLDEDFDWVLLPCDVDLDYCMRSLGKTTIKMVVLPTTV